MSFNSYTVRSTPDQGLGVFADAEVCAGSMVWRHVPARYEVLDEYALASLLADGSREDAIEVLAASDTVFQIEYGS